MLNLNALYIADYFDIKIAPALGKLLPENLNRGKVLDTRKYVQHLKKLYEAAFLKFDNKRLRHFKT